MSLPVLQPVTVAVLQRPEFDNKRLGNWKLWTQDNTGLLARYYHELGKSAGFAEQDNEEITFWCRVQHDIEMGRRTRSRLPHGDSL